MTGLAFLHVDARRRRPEAEHEPHPAAYLLAGGQSRVRSSGSGEWFLPCRPAETNPQGGKGRKNDVD